MIKNFIAFMILTVVAGCSDTHESVGIAPDKQHFVLTPSGQNFVPWGFNYDRDFKSRLIEDFWDNEWPTVIEHFREMKALGATVVRVHLQFGRFMIGPCQANRIALARLKELTQLADRLGLYLDLTGLGCYRKQDVPTWYDAMNEDQRWEAQANFWSAIARTCANANSIFCYDLINEPIVPGEKRQPRQWLPPETLGGFSYVQFITLDPAGRDKQAIAQKWAHKMVAAIRAEDSRHLITLGMLPLAHGLGFEPQSLSREVDFLSVHIYPKTPEEGLKTLADFHVADKPTVIEETFALNCNPPQWRQFVEQSKSTASGWIGFYWGKPPAQLRQSKDIGDAMMLAWLETFQKMTPSMKGPDR